MCDHTVAYMNDFITQANIVTMVECECDSWNLDAKTMLAITGDRKQYRTDRKPIEFLDRRRGYMRMFNFCPDCGEKIDWREIKKAVRSREDGRL